MTPQEHIEEQYQAAMAECVANMDELRHKVQEMPSTIRSWNKIWVLRHISRVIADLLNGM